MNGFDYLVVAAEDTLPLDPQLPVHLVQELKATVGPKPAAGYGLSIATAASRTAQ